MLRASVSTPYRSTAVQHGTEGSQQQYNTVQAPLYVLFRCLRTLATVAAQMFFVAGSALVERLRKENAVTTKDSRMWDEVWPWLVAKTV